MSSSSRKILTSQEISGYNLRPRSQGFSHNRVRCNPTKKSELGDSAAAKIPRAKKSTSRIHKERARARRATSENCSDSTSSIPVGNQDARGQKRKSTTSLNDSLELARRKISKKTIVSVERQSHSTRLMELWSRSYIDRLPNEILAKIFSYCSTINRLRLEKVCKRWAMVAKHCAWSDATKFCHSTIYSPSDMYYVVAFDQLKGSHLHAILVRCGHRLKSINLEGFGDFLMIEFCATLQSYYKANVKQLRKAVLESLTISRANLLRDCDYALVGLFKQSLKKLVIRQCRMILQTETALFTHISQCLKLEFLDISQCRFLLSKSSLRALPKSLTHLVIRRLDQRVEEDAVSVIAESCPDLKTLVADGTSFRGNELVKLLKGLPRLECLDLSNCYVSDAETGILDHTFIGLKNLKKLNLKYSIFVDDTILFYISANCKALEELDISHPNVYSPTPKLPTEAGFMQLAGLTQLKSLDLSGHFTLTDKALINIAEQGLLQSLNVSACKYIGDDSIVAVLENCRNLEKLSASYLCFLSIVSLNEALDAINQSLFKSYIKKQYDKRDSKLKEVDFKESGIRLTRTMKTHLSKIQRKFKIYV